MAEWRRQDRERLRKARGVPIRRPSVAMPSPRVSKRQAELRKALADKKLHQPLTEASGLPVAALERVAAGRSTLASTQWQRLRTLLEGALP